jgi:hypothetical protein
MANSLLDFVMSLVRDPDAAARYAADPSKAIADAHLTDVTIADVNNLIPLVTESLSMAGPTTGADAFSADPASNVWASGAATAAFDAFDDQVPDATIDDGHSLASHVIDQPDQALQVGMESLADAGLPVDAGIDEVSTQFDAPVIDDVPTEAALPADDWGNPVAEHHPADDGGSSFDIFD